MSDDRHGDGVNIAMLFVVACIALLIGNQVMMAYGVDFREDLDEYCQDEYGQQWSLDDESETLQCVHPNGTTREPIVDLHGSANEPIGEMLQ